DKNIGERLEFHNELPNQVATGKSEYRQELLRQLLSKLTTLVPEQVPTFYQTINFLLEEKQVLLFFTPPDEQQLFRKLGWTGDLTFPTCPTAYVETGCVADGLALIETNIGANRANAYISRTQEHNAALSPSGIHHERKIQYTNAAATSAWPKGDYNVYLRAYVPGNPSNIAVTLEGVPLKKTEVAVRDSDFGVEISFSISIPIASSKELILSYNQEQPLSPTSTYVFYENRQAGLIDPIAPLNVSYPNDWVVSSRIPNAIKFGSQLLFPESPSSYLMRVIQFTPAQ
ncbi:hypothetical protein KA012_03795, partial [Candidatus Woesebacteria bacterium]|nr:hypothetical protein [Candidatus Woesebacteria bacterium]